RFVFLEGRTKKARQMASRFGFIEVFDLLNVPVETVASTTEPVLSVCMSLQATSRTFSSCHSFPNQV
ncbi:hypothetical protein, partial [Escherichia coli]|uniref:hypothetical protein n=1 Tax=Escherichia coli TaxID=562 RepID=UPI001BC9B992